MFRANHVQEKSIFLSGAVGALLGTATGLVFGLILSGNGPMGAALGLPLGLCLGLAIGAIIGPQPVTPAEADIVRDRSAHATPEPLAASLPSSPGQLQSSRASEPPRWART